MTERDQARVLAALLDQGRTIHLFSCVLTGAAALALLLAGTFGLSGASIIAFAVMLIAGVVECWAAFRVGFDAKLFRDIALGSRDTETELTAMDGALTGLGLMPPGKAGRSLTQRRAGALRLLKLQAGFTVIQIAAMAGLALWRLG